MSNKFGGGALQSDFSREPLDPSSEATSEEASGGDARAAGDAFSTDSREQGGAGDQRAGSQGVDQRAGSQGVDNRGAGSQGAGNDDVPIAANENVSAQKQATFAQMGYNTHVRYVVTSKGVFHLTPTELQLVRTLEEMGEASVSKLDLSIRLQCNKRVVGRLISNLRREGVIETEAQYNEAGAQLANTYRIAPGVHPLDPDEAPREA